MQHVTALGLFLSLALGLLSLTLLARLPHRDASSGARWLPIALLLYNLWVSGFLATIDAASAPASSPAWRDLVQLGLLGIALAWLSTHLGLLAALVPARSDRGLRLAIGVLIIAAGLLGAAWLASVGAGLRQPLLVIAFVVRMSIFPIALIASGRFLLRARAVADPLWRDRFMAFGWANAGLFVALMALSISWSRLARVDVRLPVLIDVLLELGYNGMAVAWVMGVARWQASTPVKPPAAAPAPPGTAAVSDASSLLAARGITKREAEIIELICQGKTNQEIADQLFISLTTVKDHNYVTFQKLGVRNRTELTRLVLGAGAANQSRLLERRE